jgi:hypothetical protein
MCNFVIRPIKSYATVDIDEEIKRGEYIQVEGVVNGHVKGTVNGDEKRLIAVPLAVFIHTFTANPKDVETVRKEEAGWYPKPKEDKKTDKK